MGKQVLQDKKQRFFNYILDDYYISGGPTNNGGLVFEWFAKQFGDFKNAFDMESSMDELINEATKVSAGAEGLLFLPYLLGERAPIWNANARGVYFGLNINHEKKHFVRATIEGILYEVYSIGKTLQEHRTINSICVNGSFASIPFCTQLIADIFNKPVSTATNGNSVSYGAFLLSAVEMGIYKNLDEGAKTTVLGDTFKPNKQNHLVYKNFMPVFEKLSTRLSEEFGEIAGLQ
jgi:gluconokinase